MIVNMYILLRGFHMGGGKMYTTPEGGHRLVAVILEASHQRRLALDLVPCSLPQPTGHSLPALFMQLNQGPGKGNGFVHARHREYDYSPVQPETGLGTQWFQSKYISSDQNTQRHVTVPGLSKQTVQPT